ncbi:MAG: ABC transporter substrate-binding protein [Thermotogae bacterium]|nr:ABC transporter substrate-binding protein [Thermotogota bacterium]
MRKLTLLTSVLGLLALGCQPAEKVVKIGLLLPTNASGDIATYSKQVKNGIYLAAKLQDFRIGNRKVEFVLPEKYDGSPEHVSDALKELKEKGARVVIGPITSAEALAMKDMVNKLRIPTFVPTATANGITENTDWIWRVCVTNRHMAVASAYMAEGFLKVREAVVLKRANDSYSKEIAEDFRKWADNHGLKVVSLVVLEGENDFPTKVREILSAFTIPQESTAVLAPFYYDEAAKVIRTLRDSGYVGYVLGADGWDVPSIVKRVGKPAGDNYYVTHFNHFDPIAADFVEKYQSEYKEDASSFAALGYDAFLVVSDVIKRSRATLTADDIRTAAASIDVKGVTGNIELSSTSRDPDTKSVVVMRLSDIGLQFIRRLAISPSL